MALFYHLYLFCDSYLLSDSSVVSYALHGSQTLVILATLDQYPITDRGPKQRPREEHKYSKYQGRHLKFPFLNSDDQNLIYPSVRSSSVGEIRTFFGYRDFLRVSQKFCLCEHGSSQTCPPLLTTSSWAAASAGIFGGQLKERALWTVQASGG